MKQMTIIGYIGADATTKNVNGSEFVDFQVAVNESFTRNETEVQSTLWFNCSTKNVNTAQYLKKGDQVMVQGNFNVNVYKDKQGVWKSGINLHASNIQFLTPKKEEERRQGFEQLRSIIREELTIAQRS
jgi:single-strand DNA-binding protein